MEENKTPEIYTDESDLVDIVADDGRHLKLFHVGSTKFAEKWYAFFMSAEDIEGLGDEEVVVFEVSKDEKGNEVLLPVEDTVLLEHVYEQFCKEMEEDADALEAEELEGDGCCCCHHHGHEEECDCDQHEEECDCDQHEEECDCDQHEEECDCEEHHEHGKNCCGKKN